MKTTTVTSSAGAHVRLIFHNDYFFFCGHFSALGNSQLVTALTMVIFKILRKRIIVSLEPSHWNVSVAVYPLMGV